MPRIYPALLAFQGAKRPGCGTCSPNQTALADLASEGLRLRSELQTAVDYNHYFDAAAMLTV